MHTKTIAGITALFMLASCGGSNDPSADAPVNLQGLWYASKYLVQPTEPEQQIYRSPRVFVQNGRDIVVKACNRSTTSLRLEGEKLVEANGQQYDWQPSSADVLSATNRVAPFGQFRRFSTSTLFDSGRIALSVPSLAPLEAAQDVCANMEWPIITQDFRNESLVAGVLITAPYMGDYLHAQLGFESLRAGEFTYRERDAFLQNKAGSVHVALRSPAFVSLYGQETLKISTGQVRVRLAANGAYGFEGTLVTTSGAQVSFNAEVLLERRP